MLTITVLNQKGGVGKTTTTVNLGTALALRGARVLVVDLDPQAASSAWLGQPHASDELERVYTQGLPLDQAVHPTVVPSLSIAPSSRAFARVELFLNQQFGGEAMLRAALASVGHEYDVALLDCPPVLGRVNASALMAATHVLIPLGASGLDVRALSEMMDTIKVITTHYNERLHVLGLLLTRMDHTNDAALLRAYCDRTYPGLLLSTAIRSTVRLREAARVGKPVELYDAACGGALDYRNLATEVIERANVPVAVAVPA